MMSDHPVSHRAYAHLVFFVVIAATFGPSAGLISSRCARVVQVTPQDNASLADVPLNSNFTISLFFSDSMRVSTSSGGSFNGARQFNTLSMVEVQSIFTKLIPPVYLRHPESRVLQLPIAAKYLYRDVAGYGLQQGVELTFNNNATFPIQSSKAGYVSLHIDQQRLYSDERASPFPSTLVATYRTNRNSSGTVCPATPNVAEFCPAGLRPTETKQSLVLNRIAYQLDSVNGELMLKAVLKLSGTGELSNIRFQGQFSLDSATNYSFTDAAVSVNILKKDATSTVPLTDAYATVYESKEKITHYEASLAGDTVLETSFAEFMYYIRNDYRADTLHITFQSPSNAIPLECKDQDYLRSLNDEASFISRCNYMTFITVLDNNGEAKAAFYYMLEDGWFWEQAIVPSLRCTPCSKRTYTNPELNSAHSFIQDLTKPYQLYNASGNTAGYTHDFGATISINADGLTGEQVQITTEAPVTRLSSPSRNFYYAYNG
eukprot:Colp12_sorted_trinity150504_noHs@7842